MAPVSELVPRTSICHYIYSLIRLSTKLAKKLVILFYIVFILLPLTGTGKIKNEATIFLNLFNRIGKSYFPQSYFPISISKCVKCGRDRSIELSALLRTEFHIQGMVNLEKLKKWFGGPIGNIMLRSLEFILKEIGSH